MLISLAMHWGGEDIEKKMFFISVSDPLKFPWEFDW